MVFLGPYVYSRTSDITTESKMLWRILTLGAGSLQLLLLHGLFLPGNT